MALMDSNNYIGKIGAGERESRLYSNIVKKRHFYMGILKFILKIYI